MIIFLLAYLASGIIIPYTKERAFNLRRNWLRFIAIPVLNIQIQKRGNPIDQPALYISNHRSFSDPIILCRYLDAFVIAKAEVSGYPLINKGAEITGVIWVERENQDSRKNSRSRMLETLKSGYNVLVYPEGTVGKHKETLPFRPGSFKECALNGIPVVPIAIEYRSEKDLWVKPKFIPQYFYQFSKWKTEVKLEFGPPIMTDIPEEMLEKSHSWVNNKMAEMQEGWSYIFP